MRYAVLTVLAGLLFGIPVAGLCQAAHTAGRQSGQADSLDQYVAEASEFSSRARANVYFPNPQSIFLGVPFSFVNTGAGNLTFQRRDIVVSGRIPLVAVRVYDSSSKGTVDFGTGWRLSAAETITVSGNKAQINTENGTMLAFVRRGETAFQLEKDHPSDWLYLMKTAPGTLQAVLRTGMVKEFKRIEHEFRLTKVSDHNGNEIRLLYKNGLLIEMNNANHWLRFIRSKNGRILSIQDDQNREVSYVYDGTGRLIENIDLGGHPWQYTYTEAGALKAASDPLQRLNFGVEYENGRVSRLQLPSGQIKYEYDPVTRSTAVIDKKELTSRFFQNEDGITTRVVNALGEETAIALDDSRNVASLARNGSIVESMKYDQQHRILSRHSLRESTNVDRQYEYDAFTGLLSEIEISGDGVQHFHYDPKANLIGASLKDGLHKFSYSPNGDLAAFSLSDLNLRFTADSDGLIASMTDGQNAVTTFRYKAGGELGEASFPNHNKAKYTYQPSGLRSKLAYQDGRRVEYSYDPAGNLIETKGFDSNGKQVSGQMLEMNDSYQLVRWIRSGAPETTLQYDANGNLTEIKKGDSTTHFEYDAVDRLIAVITPNGERLTYIYEPGERSLIEQYEHASVLVADLWDSGFTFSHALNSTASRPLTAAYGTVRFSETLGTLQLANADGSEIVLPHENMEGALAKLHLISYALPDATQQSQQNSFNVPFNTMFMPAEYLTINCCPSCCTADDFECMPNECPCNPPPPPVPAYFQAIGADPLLSADCALNQIGAGFAVHYQVLDQNGVPLQVEGMEPLETVTVNGRLTNINSLPFAKPPTTDANGTFTDTPLGSCFGPPIPSGNPCITDQQTFSIIFTDGITYPISTVSTSRHCARGIKLDVSGNPLGDNSSFSVGTVN